MARIGRLLLVAMCALVALTFLFLVVRYAAGPVLLDHVEANVITVSWYAQQGRPVYHPSDSAERYNTQYGPCLFLLLGKAQQWFGPSITASKWPGCAAAILSLVLLFVLVRREVGVEGGIVAAGIAAALALQFDGYSFWLRPEPFLVFFSTLGLLAATSRHRLAPLVLGLCLGIVLDMKASGFAFFFPLFGIVVDRGWGFRRLALTLLVGLVVALLPFLLTPNVSLDNYLWTLGLASQHGLGSHQARKTLEWLAFLLLPLALLGRLAAVEDRSAAQSFLRAHRWLIVGLAVGIALTLVPASKLGAGPYHLLPFHPILIFLGAKVYGTVAAGQPQKRSPVPVLAFGLWLVACLQFEFIGARNVWFLLGSGERVAGTILEDVDQVLQRYGDQFVILSGVGESATYPMTSRPALVFRGMPIGLDTCTLMDFGRSGTPEPSIHDLRAWIRKEYGKPLMWLVPKGDRPFVAKNAYPPYDDLFAGTFQADFRSEFRRLGESEQFDLYVARE
jgi:hypothetical protein